jgi:hypothetical protein
LLRVRKTGRGKRIWVGEALARVIRIASDRAALRNLLVEEAGEVESE